MKNFWPLYRLHVCIVHVRIKGNRQIDQILSRVHTCKALSGVVFASYERKMLSFLCLLWNVTIKLALSWNPNQSCWVLKANCSYNVLHSCLNGCLGHLTNARDNVYRFLTLFAHILPLMQGNVLSYENMLVCFRKTTNIVHDTHQRHPIAVELSMVAHLRSAKNIAQTPFYT